MTYLDKFKLEHPDIWEAKDDYEKEHCIIGCPYTRGYEDNTECGASTCAECWAREIPEEEPETFRELLQKEHPERVSPEFDGGCFACPTTYGYESDEDNKKACVHMNCTECWDRKLPKKAEEPVEIKIEEEKKMRNLSDVIRDAVLNAINDNDIEYAVKECFESHDYSDMIERAVENYLYENIEDIADDIVTEAVRDYMRDNL